MLAFKPHKEAIYRIVFSPDGASVVTCGRKPALCVSDASTGQVRWQHSPEASAYGVGMAQSPDGSKLAVVDWHTAFVLHAETGELIRSFPGRGYAIVFTPDGESIIMGRPAPHHDTQRIHIATEHTEKFDVTGVGANTRYTYSPDGRILAGLGGGCLMLTNADTGKQLHREHLSRAEMGIGVLAFHPSDPILVFSDGPRLVAFDIQTMSTIAERTRSRKHVQDGAFTPDGKHFITVSNDTTAVMWETAGWTELRSFAWDIGPLKSVSIASDGTRAACASDRGRIVIWDLDL